MNAIKRQRDAFLILLLVLAVSGCAGLGIPRPETFDDKLAYAQATHDGLVKALTTFVNQDQIDPDRAESIQFELRRVLQALRSARTWRVNDFKTAQDKLRFANNLLVEINALVNAKKRGL